MAEGKTERRLAAIVAIDVAGYSRLMGTDEEGTLATLKAHRAVTDPISRHHGGRIVGTAGDGLLLEFPSVVEAATCAMAIQAVMAERNAEIPDDKKMLYRVGINLGDVLVDGDDIFGDGVNVAARLEGLAEPGGICISRTVRDNVRDRMDINLEDLGEVEVKNITRPVRVFRVLSEGEVASKPPRQIAPWQNYAAAAVIVLAIFAGGWWWLQPDFEPMDPAKITYELPDKPSIAVLPFDNLSNDKEQEYFADGIADDIITDLSKISGLFVIARHSSFQFKGQKIGIDKIASVLGVQFVLEGSVRRVGDNVRINAKLIDVSTGALVWAERFDRKLTDVFALQNQVTLRIVDSLAISMTVGEKEQHRRKETSVPAAHDAFLRGWAHFQRNTPGDYAKAIPYFEEAAQKDPTYRRAFAALAAVYWKAFANGRISRGGEWVRRLNLSLTGTFDLAAKNLKRALSSDAGPLAHQVLSGMRLFQGRYEEAIAEAEHAIRLNGNDPAGYEALGSALVFAGQPKRSVQPLQRAIRLNPRYSHNYQHWLGLAEFSMERFDSSTRALEEASRSNPDDERILIPLAAAYGLLGRVTEGREAVARLNALRKVESEQLAKSGLKPGIDLFLIGPLTLQDTNLWPFKNQADRQRLRDGLKRVGVPERGPKSKESPIDIPGAVTIDVVKARQLFDRGVKFVDVRGPSWNLGRVPGATHLFLNEGFDKETLATVVGQNEEVVFYCMGPACLLSSTASARAVSWGYKKVFYFRDGFPSWQAAGHPVEVSQK